MQQRLCALRALACAAAPPAGWLQALWDDMAGPFKAAVDSFKLVATTNAYIPPDKDPW